MDQLRKNRDGITGDAWKHSLVGKEERIRVAWGSKDKSVNSCYKEKGINGLHSVWLGQEAMGLCCSRRENLG